MSMINSIINLPQQKNTINFREYIWAIFFIFIANNILSKFSINLGFILCVVLIALNLIDY